MPIIAACQSENDLILPKKKAIFRVRLAWGYFQAKRTKNYLKAIEKQ